KTKKEALILASIVERETGVSSERPRVAAVFVNRLKKRMRLQSDPTIIYGLVGGKGALGRPIRRSEIRRKTAYNTYRINGLPPTPIANPGRASIAAVLNPADSKALYFVADGTGGHAFAETLEQHNKNVRRWRQIEKLNGR
ncbi:endolytic transglycosylase MltG, partial [Alphaproteobacteria bacterium]|nr:endolytic transglycosylase MltG [Alphaproteobacteria bacterium]